MSHRVLAIVEGQTEFSVLNGTVGPHLGARSVFLYPKVATVQVASIVEESWKSAIAEKTVGLTQPSKFIPYVQMHELEALLFASPKNMSEGFLRPDLEGKFLEIVEACGGCEEINDRPQFAPSKRIENIFPGYLKGRDRNKREDRRPHAAVIAARIGGACHSRCVSPF
jgi:hypothetical protein